MAQKTGFFAYPSDPDVIGVSVGEAIAAISPEANVRITPWEQLKIVGLKIDDKIREEIKNSNVLFADITFPNFNVYYEIGYGIGCGIPVIPTVNMSIDKAMQNVSLTGIFDNMGHIRYENGQELSKLLIDEEASSWITPYRVDRNYTQPLYFLDTRAKNDFRTFINDYIASSSVVKRSFDPEEEGRLTLSRAIGEVSSSSGVIIPLLNFNVVDHLIHNLRAALLTGLAHGFGLEPLIIQWNDAPAPLDYRDYITTVRSRREVQQAVLEYCEKTLVDNQKVSRTSRLTTKSLLNKIDLGASNAENEFQRLDEYFLETPEYSRALRSEGSLIIGRKGSGKSAIFYRAAEKKGSDRRNLVVDLKPAFHNLSELREELLGVMNIGVFDHTIAAVWQFMIYAEVILEIRNKIIPKAKYNMKIIDQVKAIEDLFEAKSSFITADFTSRLQLVVRELSESLPKIKNVPDVRQYLTNLLYENRIPQMRDLIISIGGEFTTINLLFDNIDKGWPARRVEEGDVRMVRHLVNILNKIQLELRGHKIEFKYLVFLRSDVYSKLVDQTSDRGKYNPIDVDWLDKSKLARVIEERVKSVFDDDGEAAWSAVNTKISRNRKSIDVMIENSLMRPRFLIDLCESAIASAISNKNEVITEEDVEVALAKHSIYLVREFGLEIRDMSGVSEKIFHRFRGSSDLLTKAEIITRVSGLENVMSDDEMIELLLWYGFLGVPDKNNEATFIYDCHYDMDRLNHEISRQGQETLYFINPAFIRGLAD